MPSSAAIRIELGVYVAPEYAEQVLTLLEDATDNSLLLDIEKTIGRRLAGYPHLREGSFGGETYEHGVDIAEVYDESDQVLVTDA